MIYDSRLEAMVAAVNTANAYANEIYPQLLQLFKPFVGEKVVKAGGVLRKKYAALVPEFKRSADFWVDLVDDARELSWVITSRTKTSTEAYVRHWTVVCVGSLRDRRLIDISDPTITWSTNYTAAGVRELRRRADAARMALNEATLALYPFDPNDI